jgi:hypothetical protein
MMVLQWLFRRSNDNTHKIASPVDDDLGQSPWPTEGKGGEKGRRAGRIECAEDWASVTKAGPGNLAAPSCVL